MPTAAKLAAAVVCSLPSAGLAAETFTSWGVPERTVWGLLRMPSARPSACLCGWFVMGGLVGSAAIARRLAMGLRTAVTLVFWVDGRLVSTYLMVLRSMSLRYDGPMEADGWHLRSDDRDTDSRLATLPVIGTTLLVGGASLAGMMTSNGSGGAGSDSGAPRSLSLRHALPSAACWRRFFSRKA